MFGLLLATKREEAGLTQVQLAADLLVERTTVAKVETGERPPRLEFLAGCDKRLGTGDLLTSMYAKINWKSKPDYHPDWFLRYVELEAKASEVREWAPYGMPGLLQTEAHMRALFAGHGNSRTRIDELTESRLNRQELLYGSTPLRLHALVDESVLLRQVGNVQVMAGQLTHLLKMSQLPNVMLQVVPLAPRTTAPPGSLMAFLDMPGGKRWFYSEALRASYCTDESAEIAQHVRLYDQTAGSALSVHQSRDRIRRVMGEMINMAQPIPYRDLKVFKSSYSSDGNGGCVGSSTTHLDRGIVPVVDTTLGAASPVLAFSTAAFAAFVGAVKAGEFAEGEKYVTP